MSREAMERLDSIAATLVGVLNNGPTVTESLSSDLASVIAPKINTMVDERCAEVLAQFSTERLRSQVEGDLESGRLLSFKVDGGRRYTIRQIARKGYVTSKNAWVSRSPPAAHPWWHRRALPLPSQAVLTQVQEELAQVKEGVEGEIGELRHQYQAFDELLAPLLERDLVGGVVQLQMNLEDAKTAMQEKLDEKMREIEARIASLPAPAFAKIARQMQIDRLNDVEARLVKLERGYKAMSAMYAQVCEMYDSMTRIAQVPTEHIKLAIELAEKLQGVGKNIDGTLRDVTVVSLSDAGWEADAYAAADASASRTPLTPERSES
jgi:hypothetical protein